MSAHAGVHELKVGGGLDRRHDPRALRLPDHRSGLVRGRHPVAFRFDGPPRESRGGALRPGSDPARRRGRVNAGLRWDRYQLVVEDNAFSPRLAAAWSWPAADLVLRASYDRAFQTPAIENLLLASSKRSSDSTTMSCGLPVPASRGNFYEAGLSKALGGRMRIDARAVQATDGERRRRRAAAQYGRQLSDRVPSRGHRRRRDQAGRAATGRTSTASLGYSHLHGIGELPITGGLFSATKATRSSRRGRVFHSPRISGIPIRGRASYQLLVRLAGSRSPDGTGAVCRSKTSTTRRRTRSSSGASASWTA